jgi:hypothetical protein
VPLCDTDDVEIWKKSEDGGHYMYWCDPPKHNDVDFSIRTADGLNKADDPTTYRPGGLVHIHIRALKLGLKYRGLLLYAEDEQGNKVGSWELPTENEVSFHTPPGSCNEQAVMHSGADPKNYHNVFAFRVPADRPKSGEKWKKITFKCLLKTGEANTGAFHWPKPNSGQVLQLTSDERYPPKSWISVRGKSCDDACKEQNKVCDATRMGSQNSEERFLSTVGSEHVCKLPILKGCWGAEPFSSVSSDPDKEFCYYNGCPADSTKRDDACGIKKGRRFCACKAASLLSEDSWTELAEMESSRAELAEIDAATVAGSHPTTIEDSCSKFWNNRGSCEAAGCHFSQQEGMVECTKSKA